MDFWSAGHVDPPATSLYGETASCGSKSVMRTIPSRRTCERVSNSRHPTTHWQRSLVRESLDRRVVARLHSMNARGHLTEQELQELIDWPTNSAECSAASSNILRLSGFKDRGTYRVIRASGAAISDLGRIRQAQIGGSAAACSDSGAGGRMRNAGCGMRAAGFGIRDMGCGLMRDYGCGIWIRDSGIRDWGFGDQR